MKTTRIEFASDDNQHIATVQRKGESWSPNRTTSRFGGLYLLAELFSPEAPDGRKHWIGADDADDIRSAADLLFCFLEGHDGTNSDIHDMYLRLLPLSDI